MGWLVVHDLWPAWTAQEPPRLLATDWLAGEGKQAQFTILHDNNTVGTIWTNHLVGDTSIQRTDIVWIERFAIDIAPLRFIIDSVFTADGLLDELTFRLANRDTYMRLHGERFHADFSFAFENGPVEKTFKVPLTDGRIITGAFNPLAQLTDLHVGQTWRMQVFNPIAALTNVGDRFLSMLVEVTGEETIMTPEGERDCLVVESLTTKAWVDRRGVMLVQEMNLPIGGKLRIVREPGFDEKARTTVRRMSFGRRKGGRP